MKQAPAMAIEMKTTLDTTQTAGNQEHTETP